MFWRLSDAAETDLIEITEFVAKQDPHAAARILDLCLDRFEMFVRQPMIGEPCDHLVLGVRLFTVGNYVIFYRIATNPEVIEIIRVLHGARDFNALLRTQRKRNH